VICPLLRSQNVLKCGIKIFAGFSSRLFLRAAKKERNKN